jgi:hypothetical protein
LEEEGIVSFLNISGDDGDHGVTECLELGLGRRLK